MSAETDNPYQTPSADLSLPAEYTDNIEVSGIKRMPVKRGWNWITEAYDLFKTKAGLWILIVLIYFVLSIAVSVIPGVGQYIQSFINPVLAAGIMLGCAALHQGKHFGVGHLFSGFQVQELNRLLILGVITVAIAYAITLLQDIVVKSFFGVSDGLEGMMLAGNFGSDFWLIVLISMLITLPLFMCIYFAPALIALGKLSMLDALMHSFKGCGKNVLPFLLYIILGLLLFIPAVIPFGMGLLVLLPVLLISGFIAYLDIYTIKGDAYIG